MSKIAYECKGCGQKYRIKENAEEVSCQVCEGELKQVKMYSVSDYEALPEAGKIMQASEGDILEALEIEGEVLPDAVVEEDPPLLDEDGNPLSPENGEAADPETGEDDLTSEGVSNPESEESTEASDEIEDLEASVEPVEEIQPEASEGEE